MPAADGASPLLLATRMLCCTQDQRFAPAIASRPNLLSCLHRPGLKVPLADVAMSGSRSCAGRSTPPASLAAGTASNICWPASAPVVATLHRRHARRGAVENASAHI
jgi:hypothetical protein